MKYNSLAWISLSLLMAIFFPDYGKMLKEYMALFVAVLIFFSVFEMNLSNDFFKYSIQIIFSLIFSFVLLPIISYLFGSLFIKNYSFFVGLMLISIVPCAGGSTIAWTKIFKGNLEISFVITLVSILLTPVIVPFYIFVLFNKSLELEFLKTTLMLFTIIIVPTGVSILLKKIWKLKFDNPNLIFFVIFIILYTSLSDLDRTEFPGRISLLKIFSLCLLIFIVSIFLITQISRMLKFEDDKIIAMLFGSSLKNLAIALLISTNFSMRGIEYPIFAYYLTQIIFLSISTSIPILKFFNING